ncbi:MAG: VWA domain-containing protein, partial [Rikenellaceae bacterium]
VAIARPQSSSDDQTVTTEGVDIVLSLDVSTSMLARDFTPNRLEAAKDVATKFVLDRKSDRIGLTIFAGESFTQSPLTTDHASLINLLNQVDLGVISDGTAIGSGLATSVNRLRDSDSKSKVVILLTDGVNNSGQITPLTAAEAAAALGIKVYTIGVGTIGTAPSPAIDAWGNTTFVNAEVQIDEETLKTIAESTGGRYFRATDNASLKSVYDEINALEKTEIDIEHFTVFSERYSLFVLLAAIIILLEILVRHLYLRQIP